MSNIRYRDGINEGDDLTDIPVQRLIADVRACVAANISVAGLALALTIPDVLGNTCYPELVYEDGTRKIRKQYASWFDAYAAQYFANPTRWFTGEMAYELRCSLLHSARAEIEYSHKHPERAGTTYLYDFALVDDGPQCHIEHPLDRSGHTKECEVRLNADALSSAICDGADACLKKLSGR